MKVTQDDLEYIWDRAWHDGFDFTPWPGGYDGQLIFSDMSKSCAEGYWEMGLRPHPQQSFYIELYLSIDAVSEDPTEAYVLIRKGKWSCV